VDDPEAAMMRVLYDEHAPHCGAMPCGLLAISARGGCGAGDAASGVAPPRGDRRRRTIARAWLFTVARNLINRRAPQCAVSQRDGHTRYGTGRRPRGDPTRWIPRWTGLLLGTALSQLSEEHRAVVPPVVLPGMEPPHRFANDLQIAEAR